LLDDAAEVLVRARERFLEQGAKDFGDAELIALILGTAVAGRAPIAVAADLLTRFGDVVSIGNAEPAQLAETVGIGTVRAIQLQAGIALGQRANRAPRGVPILCSEDAFRELGPALGALANEELHGLFLDRRHRVLARRRLTAGTDGFTVVDPRQVFKVAIAVGAAAVVLGHNHPSGDPTPSAQDREVTRRVEAAGKVLGVPLVDHIVVAGPRYATIRCDAGWDDREAPSWTAE
jgi:DNA repair protein RadC